MSTLKNPRHERYAQGLASGETQDKAYKDAGYKPNSGAASRLAGNVRIVARVQEILGRAAKKAELSAQWVLEQLERVYTQAMEGQPVLDRYGKPTGAVIQNLSSANRSLELIGKYEGIAMFTDRSDVTLHTDPIATLMDEVDGRSRKVVTH